MKKANVVCSLFLICVALLFCAGAFQAGIGTVLAPGAGFMPFGAGALLILFSVGTIVESFTAAGSASLPEPAGNRKWTAVVVVLAMLFAYAFLLDPLGFLLATFLLLTMLFKLSEGQTWKLAVTESLATTVLTYLLFDYALKCSFPRGLLEFAGF